MPLRARHEFSYADTAADMENLQRALAEALRRAGRPLAPKGDRRLLNLACGRADETGVLAKQFGEGSDSLEILGADIRAPEIAEAQARWGCDGEGKFTAQFEVHDGARFLRSLEQDRLFDIAFLRHQNYWNDPILWARMFAETLKQMDDDGLLVITSYFDREHALACRALAKLGARRLSNYANPRTRPTGDAPGKSTDRWIAVFSKGT